MLKKGRLRIFFTLLLATALFLLGFLLIINTWGMSLWKIIVMVIGIILVVVGVVIMIGGISDLIKILRS